FEVSCPELDLLAETAWSVPGVYGSRITGGGFGGCTVSIVKKSSEELFKSKVSEAYRAAFGIDCVFYTALPSDGARELFL
ncbi:MAG: galactokinase, partial [Firmicutes bacterium]|nr:galactokinase [Bacillota bacterium]